MTMPAGRYYIGDLCYVMHDAWNEVCDLVFEGRLEGGCNEGELQLKDGRRFAIYNTKWGDGTFESNGYGYFSVDSGSIGCILESDIKDNSYSQEQLAQLGKLVEIDNDFETWGDSDGTLYFGRVSIYTGSDEDYYDEDEEDEEY